MTCPDRQDLFDGAASALEHARTCPRCGYDVALIRELEAALEPPVDVPDYLVRATLERLETERNRRTVWGASATFALTLVTAAPLVLAGYSVGDQSNSGSAAVLAAVLVAAVATLFEPRLVQDLA